MTIFIIRMKASVTSWANFQPSRKAVAACQAIVDDFLNKTHQKDVTAEKLYENYVAFGDDPFIIGEPVPSWFFSMELRQRTLSENMRRELKFS